MRKSCKFWWGWAIAVAAMVLSAAPSQAFYWYGWPGSGVPPDRVIVGPPSGDQPPPRVPIGYPVVVTTPPPGSGSEPPPGTTTPEPATGLVAIVGLGALAVARSFRRKS